MDEKINFTEKNISIKTTNGTVVNVTCSYAVYCKIKLPNVAKQKWTMLQVQFGQCCNLLLRFSGTVQRLSGSHQV